MLLPQAVVVSSRFREARQRAVPPTASARRSSGSIAPPLPSFLCKRDIDVAPSCPPLLNHPALLNPSVTLPALNLTLQSSSGSR
ncbi:hypothetical protein FKM82_029388 [Ascaphus truei]